VTLGIPLIFSQSTLQDSNQPSLIDILARVGGYSGNFEHNKPWWTDSRSAAAAAAEFGTGAEAEIPPADSRYADSDCSRSALLKNIIGSAAEFAAPVDNAVEFRIEGHNACSSVR
jgi:hypothetical protein